MPFATSHYFTLSEQRSTRMQKSGLKMTINLIRILNCATNKKEKNNLDFFKTNFHHWARQSQIKEMIYCHN